MYYYAIKSSKLYVHNLEVLGSSPFEESYKNCNVFDYFYRKKFQTDKQTGCLVHFRVLVNS